MRIWIVSKSSAILPKLPKIYIGVSLTVNSHNFHLLLALSHLHAITWQSFGWNQRRNATANNLCRSVHKAQHCPLTMGLETSLAHEKRMEHIGTLWCALIPFSIVLFCSVQICFVPCKQRLKVYRNMASNQMSFRNCILNISDNISDRFLYCEWNRVWIEHDSTSAVVTPQ